MKEPKESQKGDKRGPDKPKELKNKVAGGILKGACRMSRRTIRQCSGLPEPFRFGG